MSSDAILTFADHRLDLASGQLYKGEVVVPLTPKAFALLSQLAGHPGRLLTKAELLDAVWSGVFVTDAVLKSTILELRRALGDDPRHPRFIETAHRRGYRFIAPVVASSEPGPSEPVHPRIHYARSGRVNIAYQVLGDGPVDLVFVMGWVSHLEYFWNEPSFARFLTRLSGMARLILFDKRGTGLSDRVSDGELPTLEQRMDDVRAVMEAAGSQRAVLLGVSEGGPLCALFAATHPARTEGLIMIGSYARRMQAPDYPWGVTQDERDRFCQSILDQWGGPVGIEDRAPSRVADAAFRDWWASYLRMGASPGAAVALTRMNAAIDIRAVLPSIRVPTLVLHRAGDRCLRVDEGRYLATHIPGAVFIEQPGDDHLPFVGDQEAVLAAVERFLADTREPLEADRVLASILSVSQASSTASEVSRLRPAFEREVGRQRGHALDGGGHELLAAFDGPARAVHCGAAVVDEARRLGVQASAGVHIGEVAPHEMTGPVFALAQALARRGTPHAVSVSRTVVDLVPGSGLRFEDGGVIRAREWPRDVEVLVLSR
jgi:pimeloyl-ACP methyl ester carboxylesterase